MNKWNVGEQYTYDIIVNDEVINVVVSNIKPFEVGDDGDDNKMKDKWYSFLIDQIANEIIDINKNKL